MKPKEFFDSCCPNERKTAGIFQDQDKFSPDRKQEA